MLRVFKCSVSRSLSDIDNVKSLIPHVVEVLHCLFGELPQIKVNFRGQDWRGVLLWVSLFFFTIIPISNNIVLTKLTEIDITEIWDCETSARTGGKGCSEG